MQSRIDRLEGLVLSLMTNGSQSAGATAATRALSMRTSTGSMEYPQDIDIEAQENGTNKGGGEEVESETDQVSQSLGMMKVDNNKSMYFGEAHWATIMNDVCSHTGSLPVRNNTDISLQIAEVKNYFAEHQKQFEDHVRKVQESKASEIQSIIFLFGGAQTPDYSELLGSLPKRSVTDKLVNRFFNASDTVNRKSHYEQDRSGS